MKKILIWIGIVFVILLIISLFVPSNQDSKPLSAKKNVETNQIPFYSHEFAYFKNSNRFRVFVYYVNDTNWTKIRAIGDDLMHTDGRPTVAFFYTNKNLLSQISSLNTFYDALRFGYREGCVAEYWKQPKGDVVFKKFPKEDFK